MLLAVMAKVRIQEIRKLLMPLETAVDAVLELDRAHGGTLSRGKLVEARVEFGADAGLTLRIKQGAGIAATEIQKRYALTEVAAAAIHYCARARIPLPRILDEEYWRGARGLPAHHRAADRGRAAAQRVAGWSGRSG